MTDVGGRTRPAMAAKREALPAVLLGAAGAAAWAFLGLAGEVAEGGTRAFDGRILLLSPRDPSDPLGPPRLDEAARDSTPFGSNGVPALFVLASALVLASARRRRAEAATLAATAAGAVVAEAMLKRWYGRPRPELVPHAARVSTAGFPSGHAAVSAAVLLTAGVPLARAQPEGRPKALVASSAVWLALPVGLSRVHLGVHRPTDVAAGWALGAGWAALCWAAALWLRGYDAHL